MDETSFWTLAAKHFAGEASDREAERLEAWAEADPAHRVLLAEAAEAWRQAQSREGARPNASAAWKKLAGRMARKETGPKPPARAEDRPGRPARRHRRTPLRRLVLGVGAMGLVLGAVFAALLRPDAPPRVLATERGERVTARLADGTRVHLNAESRLSLLRLSGQGSREVQLEGEAYFEVASDAQRPFLVHTHQGMIRVVGTAFNVSAYADEQRVTVAVAEGAVALPAPPSTQAASADTVVLRPRQLGVIEDQHVQAVYHEVDLSAHLAWREGRLVFENTPFPEVARRLERWYDLRIELTALGSVDRLNATLDHESSDAALRDIALALGLQYERDGDTFRFYRLPAP